MNPPIAPKAKTATFGEASTLAPTVRPPPRNLGAGLLAVGSRLAEFEVTRIVGQGGFGAVYEAWDPILERVVAIKEYLPTALSARRMDGTVVPLSERHRETFELGMRSFIKEARLLAQFGHPSLLKVYPLLAGARHHLHGHALLSRGHAEARRWPRCPAALKRAGCCASWTASRRRWR